MKKHYRPRYQPKLKRYFPDIECIQLSGDRNAYLLSIPLDYKDALTPKGQVYDFEGPTAFKAWKNAWYGTADWRARIRARDKIEDVQPDENEREYERRKANEGTDPLPVDATLNERGTRYGDFSTTAYIIQSIKMAMANSPNWNTLALDMREALEMTAHKIGRILNGDSDYIDSWHDIIGYVRLVEQRLIEEREASDRERTLPHMRE